MLQAIHTWDTFTVPHTKTLQVWDHGESTKSSQLSISRYEKNLKITKLISRFYLNRNVCDKVTILIPNNKSFAVNILQNEKHFL